MSLCPEMNWPNAMAKLKTCNNKVQCCPSQNKNLHLPIAVKIISSDIHRASIVWLYWE